MSNELPMKYDLELIEARVDDAKRRFLTALDESSDEEGKRIVEHFLSRLEADDRISSELKKEAEHEIRSFIFKTAPLTEKVALVLMKMQSTLLMLGMKAVSIAEDQMKFPSSPPPSTDFTQTLRDEIDTLAAEQKMIADAWAALVAKWIWAEEKAYGVGVHVERLLTYSADLIIYRKETLRSFSERHIKPSFNELVGLIRNRKFEKTGIQLFEATSERVRELLKEVFTQIAEEDPHTKALALSAKAALILKGTGTDTSVGGTGHLNLLVSQLRDEAAFIDLIAAAYEDVIKELDDLNADMRSA